MKHKHHLFIFSVIATLLLSLKFIFGSNEVLAVQQSKKPETSSEQIKQTQKPDIKATPEPTLATKAKAEVKTVEHVDNQQIEKDTPCADFVTNDNTFTAFLKRVKSNPNFCGANLQESTIRACSDKADKASESACLQVFLQFAALFAKDQNFDRPQNLGDKTLKTQIAKILFSGVGFQKDGVEKIMPLLHEMLRRHPDSVGLLRVFTMLRAAPLLLEALNEQDKALLDLAITQDSENISTRNALVTIYTRQEKGFEIISQMAHAYPNDVYPYATLVGRFLLEKDRKSALKWAEVGLIKNPNNKQFLALKRDIDKGTFQINNYYKFNFDISGAFDDILLEASN